MDSGGEDDPFLTFIKQPANTRKPFECRCLAKENPNPESQPVTRTALLPTYFRRLDPMSGTRILRAKWPSLLWAITTSAS